MCTVSVIPASAGKFGYDLWFNRDEKNSRAPESEPRLFWTKSGGRYLAPTDGERGGTWLTVNEHGLTACVLNNYEASDAGGAKLSRGVLPVVAAECARADDAVVAVQSCLREHGKSGFAPFHLRVFDRWGKALGISWDGANSTERAAWDFTTTSSFEAMRVQKVREERWNDLANARLSPETRREWHWAHDSEAAAESVRMKRLDARTRSICEVRVRARGLGPEERLDVTLVHTLVDWGRLDGQGARTEASL